MEPPASPTATLDVSTVKTATVTASCGNSASITVNSVGIKEVQYNGNIYNNTDKIYVALGNPHDTITLTAVANPGPTWPINQPQWTTGVTSVSVTKDVPIDTVSTDANGTAYTVTCGTSTLTVHVVVVKVEILSVQGIDENGTLNVNCKATPTVHFIGYEYVLNGGTIDQGSYDLNGGNFNFTTNQNLFIEINNTFEVNMRMENSSWVSLSFSANKTSHTKQSGVKNIFAYFIAEGIGLRIFEHKVIAEKWYSINYSVPQSGRTIQVGASHVRLFMGTDYGNVSLGEEHKYVNSVGATGLQIMSLPGSYIGVPNTEYRDSINNFWPMMDGLKGVFEVKSLVYNTGSGFIPATPILQGSLEVILN